MKRSKFVAVLIVLCLMVSMLCSCGNQSGTSSVDTIPANEVNPADFAQIAGVEGVSDETITVAYNQEIASFDFANIVTNQGNDNFGAYVNAPLIAYDSNTAEYYPVLATSWEMVDDCTYRFFLNKNAVSHNGFPLVAQDVLDSLARCCACPALARYNRYIDIENCKVIDEHTVDVASYDVCPDMLSILGMSCCYILSTEGVNAEGGYEAEAMEPQAGFGPYKFVEWVTGDHITFERDDNFVGELPYYKTAICRIINDDSARLMNLQSGDIAAANNISTALIKTVENDSSIRVIQDTNVNKMYQIFLNNNNGPLQDVNVRRALSLAYNRAGLIASVFAGTAEPSTGLYPDCLRFYVAPDSNAADYYSYDLETAKQLLADAGYADGFELNLISQENPLYMSIAEYTNAVWAELGVTVNVLSSDTPTYFARLNEGDYDAALLSTSGIMSTQLNVFDGRLSHSEGSNCQFTDGGQTFYDAIDAAGAHHYGTPESVAAFTTIQNTIRDQIPSVTLCNGSSIFALRSDLTGATLHIMGDACFVYLRPVA